MDTINQTKINKQRIPTPPIAIQHQKKRDELLFWSHEHNIDAANNESWFKNNNNPYDTKEISGLGGIKGISDVDVESTEEGIFELEDYENHEDYKKPPICRRSTSSTSISDTSMGVSTPMLAFSNSAHNNHMRNAITPSHKFYVKKRESVNKLGL